MIFDCDDIHRARVEMAERYCKMSEEDARRAIENLRREKAAEN
jgi:hypothetical protein